MNMRAREVGGRALAKSHRGHLVSFTDIVVCVSCCRPFHGLGMIVRSISGVPLLHPRHYAVARFAGFENPGRLSLRQQLRQMHRLH